MEATTRVVVALERLKGIFQETPEARLSLAEAVRLCELDTHLCQGVLTALEDVRFLTRERDGAYRRRTPDPLDQTRPLVDRSHTHRPLRSRMARAEQHARIA